MNRYTSTGRVYSRTIKLHGKLQIIRFADMGQGGGGLFVTNDAEVASALERDADFGKFFFRESGDLPKVEEAAEDKHVYAEVCENITSVREARAYLAEKYNIKTTKLQNKKDVLKYAYDLNISFPNLQ